MSNYFELLNHIISYISLYGIWFYGILIAQESVFKYGLTLAGSAEIAP